MNKFLENVKEFHETFKAPILDKPQIPSKERCDLRVSLLQEELDEIKEAIENMDMVEIADGFADLCVILCGSILEFGLGDKFEDIFTEVHKSNMSKACNSEEEAVETIKKYKEEGVLTYTKQTGDKWIIYRAGDNKILKSINYTKVDIKTILDK